MTTAVMPDIEAWMAGEIEQPCEIWWRHSRCRNVAEYLCYGVTNKCCKRRVARFVCQRCRDCLGRVKCGTHPVPASVTWLERLRGAS